jgi:hypothetical protein
MNRTVTGLDLSPAAIKAAECRTCIICHAKPKQPCSNTVRAGEPLPGRDVHYGRLVDQTRKANEDNPMLCRKKDC